MRPSSVSFLFQMGRGEELGSGVLNVNKYLPFYAKGAKPRFVEGDPFVTIIPLPSEASESVSGQTTQEPKEKSARGLVEKVGRRLVARLAETQRKILKLMRANPHISKRELAAGIEISTTAIDKNIASLKAKGLLRRIGPDKGGHWEVVR